VYCSIHLKQILRRCTTTVVVVRSAGIINNNLPFAGLTSTKRVCIHYTIPITVSTKPRVAQVSVRIRQTAVWLGADVYGESFAIILVHHLAYKTVLLLSQQSMRILYETILLL